MSKKKKFTINQVYSIERGLGSILSVKFNPNLSWDIACNMENCQSVVEKSKDLLRKLFEEYAEEKEGSEKKIPVEKQEEYNKKANEILEKEIELDYTPIKFSDLEKKDEIEPLVLFDLKPIIVKD